MDISDTLAPKSDQLDAVDLLGKPPRIFTVSGVSRGNAEQPVEVQLAEFPRVWRPGKSMRRVLAHLWGADASTWIGRRVELFCDTEVVFGGEKVGGTRISRMSHIDGPKSVPIIIKKGRSGGYKVEPLTDAAVVAALRNEWKTADAARKKAIEAEVAALSQTSGAEAAPAVSEPQVEPTSSSAPESAPICAPCAASKHDACEGQAWDNVADEACDCACAVAGHAA
jgi:hypothetical protein